MVSPAAAGRVCGRRRADQDQRQRQDEERGQPPAETGSPDSHRLRLCAVSVQLKYVVVYALRTVATFSRWMAS